MTSEQLGTAVVDLCAHFGGPNFRGAHKQTVDAYVKALDGKEGVEFALARAKRSQFMPKPAEIVDWLPGVAQQQGFSWTLEGQWSGDPKLAKKDAPEIARYIAHCCLPPVKRLDLCLEGRRLMPGQIALLEAIGIDPAALWTEATGRWAEEREKYIAFKEQKQFADEKSPERVRAGIEGVKA